MRVTVSTAAAAKYLGMIHFRMRPNEVLSEQGIATGGNSGYQACNLAFLLGAAEIYLLGVDCKANGRDNHWHPDHDRRSKHGLTNPNASLYRQWIKNFAKLHAALAEKGVKLMNCSRDSALTVPRARLEDVLATPQNAA